MILPFNLWMTCNIWMNMKVNSKQTSTASMLISKATKLLLNHTGTQTSSQLIGMPINTWLINKLLKSMYKISMRPTSKTTLKTYLVMSKMITTMILTITTMMILTITTMIILITTITQMTTILPVTILLQLLNQQFHLNSSTTHTTTMIHHHMFMEATMRLILLKTMKKPMKKQLSTYHHLNSEVIWICTMNMCSNLGGNNSKIFHQYMATLQKILTQSMKHKKS